MEVQLFTVRVVPTALSLLKRGKATTNNFFSESFYPVLYNQYRNTGLVSCKKNACLVSEEKLKILILILGQSTKT
jgi:hypothetical protein